MRFRSLSLKVKFTFGAMSAILIVMIGGMLNIYRVQRDVFNQEIQNRIRSVSSFSEASREYVKEVLRPTLSKHIPGMVVEGMSSTFVTRSIMEAFAKQQPGYSFKQPALNPLNPINQADDFEKEIINRLQKDTNLKEISGFRKLPSGEKQFFVARPILVEKSCLACHSAPAAAPKELIERYGSDGGFHWKVGEIVSVTMISVPADDIDKFQSSLLWTVMATFTILALLLGILIYILFDRLIARRLQNAREVMDQVAANRDPNVRIDDLAGDELGQMGKSFNRMAEVIEELRASLERKVELRTTELAQKNTEIETNRQHIQAALNEITQLIEKVSNEKRFGIYFRSVAKSCWQEVNCGKEECPCYGKAPMECWSVRDESLKTTGTPIVCGRGDRDCNTCSFRLDIEADPVYRIGVQFNNMMHILEGINHELKEAYAKLKATQSQMLQREKMASLGQLAAGVAHEINNPMGFITSNLGSLRKYVNKYIGHINSQSDILASLGAEDKARELRKNDKIDFIIKDSKELLDESLDGARRVVDIVQNLKGFARLDEAIIKEANINECLDVTLKIIWNELKYKCTLHKDYGELPMTLCNAQELNQVFMNILVNAAQSIDKQGDITIRTWAKDGFINVSIADTGSGIPRDKINKIFDPFFTTKEVGKGTGLGLSICYDIVKKHEGELTVESEINRGTTFIVSLPVRK